MEVIAAAVVFLAIGYVFGFYVRDLWDTIKSLKQQVTQRRNRSPKSAILEPPLTPEQQAQRDMDELLESMNPRR